MSRFRRKIPPQVSDASGHVNARPRAIHLAISPFSHLLEAPNQTELNSPVGIAKRPTPQLNALNLEPPA